MYRKVSLSSFHNGKVEYCAIFGSGDIEENASVIFFTQTLHPPNSFPCVAKCWDISVFVIS